MQCIIILIALPHFLSNQNYRSTQKYWYSLDPTEGVLQTASEAEVVSLWPEKWTKQFNLQFFNLKVVIDTIN